MDGPEIADNLATPWVGVRERIGIYAYQLWLVVLRSRPCRPTPVHEGR